MRLHPLSFFAARRCLMVFFFDANCLIVFIFRACYYSTRYLPGYTVQAGDIIVYNTQGILRDPPETAPAGQAAGSGKRKREDPPKRVQSIRGEN